jgi:nitrite reductase/ring-hydroxylating ferredoxin subunit
MSRHIVAAVRDLPIGGRKAVTVNGRPIVVFNVGGEYFGLLNRCPHQGACLSDGILGGIAQGDGPGKVRYTRQGEFLRCPWHGWEFDIRTGRSWCDPQHVLARTYPVAVTQGTQLVERPYVAETFPVSAEEEYLVVEV